MKACYSNVNAFVFVKSTLQRVKLNDFKYAKKPIMDSLFNRRFESLFEMKFQRIIFRWNFIDYSMYYNKEEKLAAIQQRHL